jgi:hypothetical protein
MARGTAHSETYVYSGAFSALAVCVHALFAINIATANAHTINTTPLIRLRISFSPQILSAEAVWFGPGLKRKGNRPIGQYPLAL